MVTLLDPNEKHAFEEMVTHLRTGDPKLERRLTKLSSPRRRARITLAVGLWVLAPVSIFYGGWTGFLLAVIGAAYGARLVLKKHAFEASSPWAADFPSPRRHR